MTVDTHTLALLLHPAEVLHEEASEVDPADPTVQAVAKPLDKHGHKNTIHKN